MVIPVRNSLAHIVVLLLGICPLWNLGAFAAETDSYGPITPSDTLAEIAIKLKGDGPWHYHRWMYVLYQKNPHAFFGDNMNNLKMGAMLKTPSEDELKSIDLAEAFRAVKVHLYVLQQSREEKRVSDEDLVLRARLQRLFSSNEMMQQESGELFERIEAMEQQMGSVVDHVLESEEKARQQTTQSPRQEESIATEQPEPALTRGDVVGEESSAGWWLLLLTIMLIYAGGFFWRRRLEANL